MWVIIFSFLLTLLLLYFKLEKHYSYWKEKGIPYSKPLYFFGNFAPTVFRIQSVAEVIQDIYDEHRNEPCVGFFQFHVPTLLLSDPQLIQEVTIKQFDKFPQHTPLTPIDIDPLWGKNLFAISAEDGWQSIRSSLSPAFTRYKTKLMFPVMQRCAKQFVEFLQNDNKTEIELRDVFSRFTSDVLSDALFRIESNSFQDKDCKLYAMTKNASDFSGFKILKFMGYVISPRLMNLLNVKMYSAKATKFFTAIVNDIINIEERNIISRLDLIHMLEKSRTAFSKRGTYVEAKPKTNPKVDLSDNDIVAQAMLFSVAAFDTASAVMCYTVYELALNQSVQAKLYAEIQKTLNGSPRPISFEALSSMQYLENVIAESLRLHPPFFELDRYNVEPHTLIYGEQGEKRLELDKGTVIWIPIRALQRDPKYFPNPEKFDPTRFNSRNKKNIKPYTYMPFGYGPRACVGFRFALWETKLIIVELLRRCQFVATEKTPIQLRLSKTNPNLFPDQKIYLGLKPRLMKI